MEYEKLNIPETQELNSGSDKMSPSLVSSNNSFDDGKEATNLDIKKLIDKDHERVGDYEDIDQAEQDLGTTKDNLPKDAIEAIEDVGHAAMNI